MKKEVKTVRRLANILAGYADDTGVDKGFSTIADNKPLFNVYVGLLLLADKLERFDVPEFKFNDEVLFKHGGVGRVVTVAKCNGSDRWSYEVVVRGIHLGWFYADGLTLVLETLE